MPKPVRKMTPEASAAAHMVAGWFVREVEDATGDDAPEIVETLIGGRAFIAEVNGIKLAVLIMEQDENGPILVI